jgi:hypothetical protein
MDIHSPATIQPQDQIPAHIAIDPFRVALLVLRLFGAVSFVIGAGWLITSAVIVAAAVVAPATLAPATGCADALAGWAGTFFFYGAMNLIGGVLIVALARPVARYVVDL